MKRTERLVFIALFIILAAIWLLVLWPIPKPPVIPTITPSYTNTPTVTTTVTPTQTYNPTATYTPIISPTLTIATSTQTSTLTATKTPIIWTVVPPIVPTSTVVYRIFKRCDLKYSWMVCEEECCK